jgi:hypothetical protein
VPFKPVMIAHASHRGDFALSQLTEVLKTMSFDIVEEAHLRIGLLGKDDAAQAAVLDAAVRDGVILNALAKFCGHVRKGVLYKDI